MKLSLPPRIGHRELGQAVTDRLRRLLRPADETGQVRPMPAPAPDPRAVDAFNVSPDPEDDPDPPPTAVRRPAQLDPAGTMAARGLSAAGRFGLALNPGRPGARALTLVGVLAALVAAAYLWRSRPVPQPVPDPANGQAAPTLSAPTGTAAPPAGAPGPGGKVTVHVAGKVRRPGVVTVAAGSRVEDAVDAAGGSRPGADTSTVNLARRVIDGEQILVGVPGIAGAGAAPGAAGAGSTGATGPQLDLNSATAEQVQQLPGVGPVLAQRILDFRTQQGGYRSVDQLREVTGIGERRFAELKGRVRV